MTNVISKNVTREIMGKKSTFKKIRRLAAMMPQINTKAVIAVDVVTSNELMSKGIKEVNGKPICAGQTFRQIKHANVPVNHNRKMKKLYNSHGKKGINAYMHAVKNFTKQQTKTSA